MPATPPFKVKLLPPAAAAVPAAAGVSVAVGGGAAAASAAAVEAGEMRLALGGGGCWKGAMEGGGGSWQPGKGHTWPQGREVPQGWVHGGPACQQIRKG